MHIQIHSSNEEGRFIKANDRNQKRAMMLRRTAIYRKYADRSNPVSAVLCLEWYDENKGLLRVTCLLAYLLRLDHRESYMGK